MKKIIVLHGTGESPESFWYPWLKKETEKLIRAGLVIKKPTGYGLHVSLNVRMKAEIEKIIFEED